MSFKVKASQFIPKQQFTSVILSYKIKISVKKFAQKFMMIQNMKQ